MPTEPFIPLNGSGGNSAPVMGGRRRSGKKLRTVKKSTVRRMLRAKGLKMRGGGVPEGATTKVPETEWDGMSGGRRRRGRSQKKTRRRSMFGMRY